MYPIVHCKVTPQMFHNLTLEIKSQLGYMTSNTHGFYNPVGWQVAWVYNEEVQQLNVFVKHPSSVTHDVLREWEEKLVRAAWGDQVGDYALPVVLLGNEEMSFFECPGCRVSHQVMLSEFHWNGSRRTPTLRPCLMYEGCHLYVENGKLRFLACGHALSNTTVDMLPMPVQSLQPAKTSVEA
jgi:hypothetical protein